MRQSANFKINIGLYVTSKRPDGFHNIETIFYPVSNVCDTISVEASSNELEFAMQGADFIGDNEKNLCVKAFRLLQKKYGIEGCRISLQKCIPSGAGLGGGSSDAATVLKMLNQFYDLKITDEELFDMAASLGSDVPFFILNRPAYATGKGEILEEIDLNLHGKVISVFKPAFSVPTAEAYANITPLAGRPSLTELIHEPIPDWKNLIPNDFEIALADKYPQLAEIKQKFYDLGADYAALSGSGSAVFAIADSPLDLSTCFVGQNL